MALDAQVANPLRDFREAQRRVWVGAVLRRDVTLLVCPEHGRGALCGALKGAWSWPWRGCAQAGPAITSSCCCLWLLCFPGWACQSLVFSDPEFLLGDLVSGVRYCLKARLTDLAMKTMSPYSEAQCFQTKGTFKNVRILAFDTTFLLKWDWDYEQQPNVTFTAQRISKGMSWRVFDSCENINKTECDMSAELYMFTSYQLRVIAQDGQGNKNFSDSINFLPKSDTVIGPPTSLTVKVMNGALNIMAREPSVLSMPDVSLDCVPAFQLKRWKNSSDHQEEYRGDSSFFTVEHVEPSTEYCLKMRVVCKRNRTGLYSETVCITTDPDGDLPPLTAPKNVKIYSYNLEQELRWDPVIEPNLTSPVTYTVQYKLSGDRDDYSNVCENITVTHCNFTPRIRINWRVKLRVRAELGPLASDWIETPLFQATVNTVLGPVKELTVSTYSKHYSLSVAFQWPLTFKPLWTITYELYYWKKSNMVKKKVTSIQSSHLLEDLDPWTEYCVEVTILADRIVGETSDAVCGMPTGPALTTGGHIAVFLSLLIVFAICVSCAYLVYNQRLAVKNLFRVPIRIPEHVQEFFEDQSCKGAAGNVRPALVAYDHVSIVDIELLYTVDQSPEDTDQAEKT
uniref:Fibronectin type-III domain-containing protein n=1 Tax=Leptobrachium leishanense TaxID=445787 RepID=A0A8C5PC70_9ANUR